jgi:uncharacterized membrane protein YfcA
MDDVLRPDVLIFLLGTFAAAFVHGMVGFAFAIVAAGVWLHALPPAQATALIVAYALIVQGYAVWKLRHSLNASRLAPFVAGTVLGIPIGIATLRWASPTQLRVGAGAILVLYSVYSLARAPLPSAMNAGRVADTGIGVLNGALGGATGLAGLIPAIWTGLRGWTRDEQRAVFQPTAAATFVITILFLSGFGIITQESMRLFALGLPVLAAGSWLGWRYYGRLDEGLFRKAVLMCLLVSGLLLLVPGR